MSNDFNETQGPSGELHLNTTYEENSHGRGSRSHAHLEVAQDGHSIVLVQNMVSDGYTEGDELNLVESRYAISVPALVKLIMENGTKIANGST